MRQIWVISDTHINHTNILSFEDELGRLIRPMFDNIDQMNEYICDNWAETVKDGDIVYHLGDVYFGKAEESAKLIRKLPGRKRLIVGNHDDIKKIAKQSIFQKIQLWRAFKEFNCILSHIPIHSSSLFVGGRQNKNVHGHTHQRVLLEPYKNVCVEQVNYTPVNLEEITEV